MGVHVHRNIQLKKHFEHLSFSTATSSMEIKKFMGLTPNRILKSNISPKISAQNMMDCPFKNIQ